MSLELVPMIDTQVANFDNAQLEDLHKPLNESLIKERPGQAGKMFKYITGKTAIDTANQIFGVGKWGYRVLSLTREKAGDQDFYAADIELYVLGCPFPFPGQGEGVPKKADADQYAKARKEAVTDALKRALRHFGDRFGLALYDEESLVEDEDGNLKKVKDVHPGQNAAKASQNGKKTVEATTDKTTANKPKTLDQVKRDAIECGFITGRNPEELRASWIDQMQVIFGTTPIESDLSQPANLARINGAIEAHRRHMAERKATVGK